MAIKREIKWAVAADGAVTPTTPLDGGAQGDHNQVRAIFEVAEGAAWADPANAVYIECVDGAGNVDTTEQLSVVDGQVAYLLPRAWTQYGGTVTLRLVAEGPGVGDVQAYASEALARLDSRQNASQKVDGLLKGRMAEMEKRANDALSGAEKAEAAALTHVQNCYQHAHGAQLNAQAAAAAATAAAVNASAAQGATAAADAALAAVQSATEAAKKAADDAGQALVRCNNHSLRAESAATQCGQYATAAEAAAKRAEAAGGGGGITVDDVKPFRFTVTQKGKKYTSSATYEEINEVLTAGNRLVICEFNKLELPYACAYIDTLVFYSSVLDAQTYIYIKPSATVQVEQISDPVTVVNVLDYGAVGNGVEDDTDAIQEALYDAEALGIPLYIPAGTYKVSSTITTHTRDTDADEQSKALNIYGEGMNTVFTTTVDFDGDYVFHIDVKKVQPRMLWVHDFAIDLVADVSGIYFNEIGMKAVVENLWITHLYDKDPTDTNVRAGIYCRESTCTTFQRIKVYGNRKRIGSGHENIGIVCEVSYSTKFIDCDIIFCKWAIYLAGGSNNLIEYCRIDENEYGVYQNSTAPTINYMPETRAYPADGEKFKGTARNLTIRNNRFESNNQQAIFLAAYSYGEMNYMYNAQVTIANNDFSGLGKGIAFQTSAREVFRKAIWLFQCKGVVIENNCFSGQPYDETVEDTALQNLVGEKIEDITLRGNVAITKPIWYDDGSHTIEKTNPVLSVEFVSATEFIPDIEADQSSRYSLGDVSLALDSIIAIQEGLIGGEAE